MYIIDPEQQRLLIAQMNQLRKDNQTWEVYYHEPSSNVMWKSFFPKVKSGNRQLKILRSEPVPDTLEERLGNCLIGSGRENAIGLGMDLSAMPQKWEALMEIIEENYRRYDRKLLPLFLKNLEIEDINDLPERSDILGTKWKELAGRSKKIRFKRYWLF
jgi:hypothetical protein